MRVRFTEARPFVREITLGVIGIDRDAARPDFDDLADAMHVSADQLDLHDGMAAGCFDVAAERRGEIGVVDHCL